MIQYPIHGGVVLVDEDDLPKIMKYKWHVSVSTGYAYGYVDGKKIAMHQLILPTEWPLEVDHDNHNKLDNRRSNLRQATKTQNGHNRIKEVGVNWDKRRKRYRARIKINYQDYCIGYFKTLEGARKARDRAKEELGVNVCTSPSAQQL